MRKLRIGLDFDGVISDCGKLKSRVALEVFGKTIEPRQFKKEIVVGGGLMTLVEYRRLQEIIYGTREYGLLMEMVPGAREYITRLFDEGHELKVITSRGEKELAIAMEWSDNKHLPLNFEGLGHGVEKTEAARGFDVYIDDDLEKLEPLVGVVPHRFLFSWGYNQADNVGKIATRVSSWSDFYEKIQAVHRAS